MKLKLLLYTIVASLFISGCAPSTPKFSTNTTKQILIGSWYGKAINYARDKTKVVATDNVYFRRNGTMKSNVRVSFFSPRGKKLGAVLLSRKYSWNVKNGQLITYFTGCSSKKLYRSKTLKIEMFSDVAKLGCKYATRIPSIKKEPFHHIRLLSKNKLLFGESIYKKLR